MTDEETSKKVLIITYYWPPSGGSGVQRWLKFVKYLPDFGWHPYVFTPENPSFEIKDETLLKDVPPEAEVLHFPIWEPYALFNKIAGVKSGKENDNSAPKADSLFKKISIWIRGNFFIPDPRIFWIRPSVKFLDDFIREKKIRTIITTGPPHSVHLIGLGIKKKNPSVRWIADFRDPWSAWGFLDTINVGKLARMRHKFLEKSVLQTADKVITITPFYVKHFEKLSNRKVLLFTNGFDEEDFRSMILKKVDRFVIRHAGIVNELCNPVPVMLSIKNWFLKNKLSEEKVQIDFVGSVNGTFKSFIKNDDVLRKLTTFTPAVSHTSVVEMYSRSAVLLLVLTGYKDGEGYMPGKLFEYMATSLPILAIGPVNGDAANLLTEARSGKMLSEEDETGIHAFLNKQFYDWSTGKQSPIKQDNAQYSRRMITKALTEILI